MVYLRLAFLMGALSLAGLWPAPAVGADGAKAPFRIVYGWYPQWIGSEALAALPTDLLTHVAWFAVDVDTATGALTNAAAWRTTPVAPWCEATSTALHCTITCFGEASTTALLSSATRRSACVQAIRRLLEGSNASGVNIDFEQVPRPMRDSLTAFMSELRRTLGNAELTIALPAVDWAEAFDAVALAAICDVGIMMGYDYSWAGSPTAGPVAPLTGRSFTVTRSIDTWLEKGFPASRLVLAMPLYGREWAVESRQPGSTVLPTVPSRARTFASIVADVQAQSSVHDPTTASAWFTTEGPPLRQTWWDDSLALAAKVQFARERQLAGIAYWALGYDGGHPAVWNGLRSAGSATSIAHTRTQPSAERYVCEAYTMLGERIEQPWQALAPLFVRYSDGTVECVHPLVSPRIQPGGQP